MNASSPEIFVVTRDGSNLTLWATGLGQSQRFRRLAGPRFPPGRDVNYNPDSHRWGSKWNVSFFRPGAWIRWTLSSKCDGSAGINSGAPIVIAVGAAALSRFAFALNCYYVGIEFTITLLAGVSAWNLAISFFFRGMFWRTGPLLQQVQTPVPCQGGGRNPRQG